MSTQPPLSDRVRRLWEQAHALSDDSDPADRIRLVTESYKGTEGRPMPLRRARALACLLARQPIGFEDRVVFAVAPLRRVSEHTGVDDANKGLQRCAYPEAHGLSPGRLPADAPEALREAAAWWAGHGFAPLWQSAPADEATRALMRHGAFHAHGWAMGHEVPDFPGVLAEGLAPRLERARRRLAELPGDDPRRTFFQAAEIVLQAALDYAARLAAAARAEAAASGDPVRARDLAEAAAALDRVPALPPRTFREAIQAVWLVHRVIEQEQGGPSGGSAFSLGRLDQTLLPWYEADLAAGRLAPAEAQELVDAFWCKLYRLYDDQNVCIGGQRPDGRDGVNPLSEMFLEAMARLPYHRDLTVRVHAGTPRPFFRRCVEVLRLGLGRPDFQNDDVVVPGLVARGVPVELARDYAPVGCVETVLPGRSCVRTMAQAFHLLKILELALGGGRCLVTGDLLVPGVPETFGRYEDLHACYRALVADFQDRAVAVNLAIERAEGGRLPHPFLSTVNQGPLETGRDLTAGGCPWNITAVNLVGIADVANSLYAIREGVFREGAATLPGLVDALRANWRGHERLQARLRALPKFGNDVPAVDAIAAEEAGFWARRLARFRTAHGGFFMALLFGTTSNCVYGLPAQTGASADGRCAGEPLAKSAEPAPGTDLAGPTALLRSVASLPGRDLCGGVSFIADFDPALFEGETGLAAAEALLRGYFAAGGAEIGPNVLDVEALRKARSDPRRYGHILVRIFGYSARFTTLSPELQDYIIARAEHRRPEPILRRKVGG